METIKNRYDNGIIAGTVPESINSTNDNKYTLVLGDITSVSHNNGFARAKVGDKIIEITFKRKAVYMYGYKLHSKSSLVERQQVLETGTWTMLVYPIMVDNSEEKVHYVALALWQYQYQHYVASDLLYRILTEGNSLMTENYNQNADHGDRVQDDKRGRHMTGMIIKVIKNFGIIESRSVTAESTYICFNRSDLFVDGGVLNEREFKYTLDRSRQCNLYAHSAEYRKIDRVPITMEATLVWIGRKPLTAKSSSSPEPLMCLPDHSDGMVNGACGDNRPFGSFNEHDIHYLRSSMGGYEGGYDYPDDLSPSDDHFHKAAQVIRPSSPVTEHKAGRFVFLGDRFGVIKCGNKKFIDDDYILFDFSILWIDGEHLGMNEGLYDNIMYDDVQCNLLAYAIPNVEVGGFPVNMQAAAVWLGKKPYHIRIPGRSPKSMEVTGRLAKLDFENSTPKDMSGYVTKSDDVNKPTKEKEDKSSDITDKLAQVTLNDSSAGVNVKEIVIDPKNPYVGKHVGGCIVKLLKDKGVALWRCAALEGNVYIEFSRKNMYVDLRPMTDHYQVDRVRGCNLFVLPMKPKEIEGYTVSLYATCGWVGSKPQNVPLPGDQAHAQISLEGLHVVSIATGKHLFGQVVKLMKEKGIARWRSVPHGGDIFIEFERCVTSAPMQLLFEHTLDSETESQLCQFYVVPIEHKEVCGYTVSLSATCGWIGRKPTYFPNPKTPDYPVIPDEKLHITPVDTAILESHHLLIKEKIAAQQLSGNKNLKAFDNVRTPTEIDINPKKPYVGKHVGGCIVKLLKDSGVALWRCAALGGNVYIEFKRKNMYVDLCPMTDHYEVGGHVRGCNLYVLPMKPKEIDGYIVSLYATCGWMGCKPHDIPLPGDQDHAEISLEGLHVVNFGVGKHVFGQIVKLLKDKGIARWRSVQHGGDIFVEFERCVTSAPMQLLFDQTLNKEIESQLCQFYVVPIEHKEVCGYTLSLIATCGWIGKKPTHFPKPKTTDQPKINGKQLHITPVDPAILESYHQSTKENDDLPQLTGTVPKDKSIKALDNVSTDEMNNSISKEKAEVKKKKNNKNEEWEDDSKKTDMDGKIVELHSNVGRLQGIDGNQHFFSREHCYLYGVNLSSVELWHVLVQDEKVSYRLNEISAGQTKVSKMWIGPENIEDVDKAAAFIYEWCKKHLVPDGARELLIHQLEVTNDSSNTAKDLP